MRGKSLLALLLCLAVLLSAAPLAFAEPAQEEKEWVIRHISSVEDLEKLAEDCRLDSYSRNLHVVLDKDLDLEGTAIQPIPSFGGVFDGGGHSITGLHLATDGSHQGLFRYIQEGAEVRDLHISGSIAPENGRCQLGGLAGENRGSVLRCSFEGSVSGKNAVGGLIGENYGTVRDCSASGTVDGKRMTGGLVGYNEGVIADCSSEARVNTTISEDTLQLDDLRINGLNAVELTNAEDEDVVSDSGGVVGYSSGVVRDCVNSGEVGYPHFGYNVGGIAGRQAGFLTGCENSGPIYGRKDVGGIVGQMEPYLVLKESVNLLEELALLNYKMNLASGTLGVMSDEMQGALDEIDQSSSSASGKIGGGGSISPVSGDTGGSGTVEPAPGGGSIAPVDGGGTISGGSGDSGVTDQDLQDGLDYVDDNTSIDTDNITVPDGLSDDLSGMADGMLQIYAIMASNGGVLSDELTDANDQLARVLMLMANALNGGANRQIFEDISDELDEDDVEGRVSHCVNHGSVEGDKNVGGIAGEMGIEYEFDMEGDLAEVIGIEGIVSNTFETKCISSDNVNRGVISARRDGVGGIAGGEQLGCILRCESYGAVSSSDGGYVGGVVGCSYSVVRQSYAMCNLSGREYVGGVAGYGTTVQDCVSMVGLSENTAFSGAVAGWADVSGDAVTGNYFVHEHLGAVDGISYEGKAVPVTYEELLSREDLPEQFRSLRLRFEADGELVAEIEFSYGGGISASQIPPVPEKEGYTGAWPDYDYSALYYSAVIEAVYTPREGALASRNTREDSPMAIVLIQGDFDRNTELLLNPYTGEAPQPEDGQVLETWVMRLSKLEEGQSYSLRYLPPELERGRSVEIYVLRDGQWVLTDTEQTGSYLSFDCDESTVVFSAVEVQKDRTGLYLGAGITAAAVLVLALAISARKRKRKKTADKTEEKS